MGIIRQFISSISRQLIRKSEINFFGGEIKEEEPFVDEKAKKRKKLEKKSSKKKKRSKKKKDTHLGTKRTKKKTPSGKSSTEVKKVDNVKIVQRVVALPQTRLYAFSLSLLLPFHSLSLRPLFSFTSFSVLFSLLPFVPRYFLDPSLPPSLIYMPSTFHFFFSPRPIRSFPILLALPPSLICMPSTSFFHLVRCFFPPFVPSSSLYLFISMFFFPQFFCQWEMGEILPVPLLVYQLVRIGAFYVLFYKGN